MTISLRSVLCLCAALRLCFGVVSAQQPAQQRFLRFLGQRSVATGTLDVSHLAQGAYTLHVQSGRGWWTRRVLILR